jgi:hypothetical protein
LKVREIVSVREKARKLKKEREMQGQLYGQQGAMKRYGEERERESERGKKWNIVI